MNTFSRAANMRNGVFFFILSALFGWQGALAHDGGDWALSAALFPVILAVALAVLSLLLFMQSYLSPRTDGETSAVEAEFSVKRAFFVFLLCIAYLLLLPVTGFFPATTLFLALFCVLAGERRPWVLLLTALLSPTAIFVIFRHGLNVLLP